MLNKNYICNLQVKDADQNMVFSLNDETTTGTRAVVTVLKNLGIDEWIPFINTKDGKEARGTYMGMTYEVSLYDPWARY